jgi:soluble lytic murein transglycosylase-like protein
MDMSRAPGTCRLAAVALVALFGLPATAAAQIYAWKDSAGNWVLSDRQKDSSARTYAISQGAATSPASFAVVSTEPVAGLQLASFRTTRTASSRAEQFDALIKENAAAHGVSPHLVRAVIQQESGFNPRAVSHKGAMGLMQLMPATAADLGVLDPFDPSENIRAGVKYLKGLLTKFAENVPLALAAYNAGPTAVERYGAVPPFRETRDYVSRITKVVDAAPKPKKIYRTYEIVNGREVPKYSTVQTPGAELITVAAPKRPSN